MKKLILAFVIVLLSWTGTFAQEVIPKSSSYGYGLYNNLTKKWVVEPTYRNAKYIFEYKGVHYYAIQDANMHWGFVESSDFTRFKINPKFKDWGHCPYWTLPLVAVKQNNNWGLIELHTSSCFLILPTRFQSIAYFPDKSVKTLEWGAKNGVNYSYTELTSRFNKSVEADRKNKEEESLKKKEEEFRTQITLDAQRREEEERIRLKKEEELSSFTEYAKLYVTPRINEWQKKGEFEKLSEYQTRVTGERRLEKIAEYSKEAEALFIDEHSKLNHTKNMILELYDSENEVFSIMSDKFGQLLLPVPIEDGQAFKQHFSEMIKSDARYFIKDDKIALSSLVFTDPATGKSYKYSNAAGLNYSRYEINADSFEFEGVRISSTTTSTVRDRVLPTCEILSPQTGDNYSTGTITIRYRIKVEEGLTYDLKIEVNGEEVVPTTVGTTKGARMATGEEVEIQVPRKSDELCNIAMWVADSEGLLSNPQKVRLKYVGERPKPRLHLFAVGISDYPADDLTSLKYASKDAKDFINTITTSNTDIYSNVTTSLLTDKAATRSGVLSGLKKLVSGADQGDVVMVYFSGHGVPDGDQFFYMTHDASAQECYNGVDFQAIRSPLKALTEEKKCHVILFMDTCYSGAMFGMKSNTKEFSMTVPGLVGFYSSTSGQQSAEIDKLQNGAFTHAILAGLKGAAKNSEGEITINELETFIKRKVAEDTKGKQNPIVENLLGDAVLFKVK